MKTVEAIRSFPKGRRYRLRLRLIALGLLAVGGYLTGVLLQEGRYGWALVPTALIAAGAVLELVIADVWVDSRFPRETEDFLDRLRATLMDRPATHEEIVAALDELTTSLTACRPDSVSATVHLLVKLHDEFGSSTESGLVQLSDYTNVGIGGSRWRTFPITKGVIGQCIRTQSKCSVNFSTQEEYFERMVTEFGFTDVEARRRTRTARSYLAFPIRAGNEVIGVIYLQSTQVQVFPGAASEHRLREASSRIVAVLRSAGIL